MNKFLYTFVVNNEVFRLTHEDFLKDENLVEAVRDPELLHYYCGLTVLSYEREWLASNPKALRLVQTLEDEMVANPLRFFAPNSQEQLDFINDGESTVCAIVEPNRVGKSTCAYIKMLVGPDPMIKADPGWEIFTQHGVKYHEFRRPISCGVATYNTAKLEDPIWKELVKKWTPDCELGKYARKKVRNGRYGPSFGHDRHIQFDSSGSQLGFYTYEMDQGNYEGGALKKWMWDEQGRKAMWDGADRGTRTTNGVHYFSLTPHSVQGRPDTGAQGWLYPFLSGRQRYGHVVKTHTGTRIMDAPDWVYPERQKAMEVEKWETEPLKIQAEQGISQRKVLAEGRARLYGEWHVTSDVVLDEWQPEYSWIDPLWEDPPGDLTLYRAIDHGINNPTAVLWFAVDRDHNIFLYRSMYQKGQTIGETVRRVIELSGNERRKIGEWRDGGIIVEQYEEIYRKEFYAKQVMDSRSFSLPDKMCGKPHGWLYQQSGMRSIKKAAGKFSNHWIPLFQELLHVDPERVHPVTGELGSPRFFVFNKPCNQPFRHEMENFFWKRHKEDEEKPKDQPEKKNDHGINAAAYGIMIPMRYLGNPYKPDDVYTEGHSQQVDLIAAMSEEEGYRSIG